MSPDVSPVPPESTVIRLAREAAGMSAQDAAEASRAHDGKGVSAAYWRDVERGHGGRRGVRVPTRASAAALAAMARTVGVTPAQLTEAGRGDAARVLEEVLRRESAPAMPPPGSRRMIGMIANAASDDDVAPFLQEVREELARAVLQHGPGHTGAQAFANTDEAGIWDNPRFELESKERLIATFRLWAKEGQEARDRARTGLVRYIAAAHNDPVTTAIRTPVSVGGKALRASV